MLRIILKWLNKGSQEKDLIYHMMLSNLSSERNELVKEISSDRESSNQL